MERNWGISGTVHLVLRSRDFCKIDCFSHLVTKEQISCQCLCCSQQNSAVKNPISGVCLLGSCHQAPSSSIFRHKSSIYSSYIILAEGCTKGAASFYNGGTCSWKLCWGQFFYNRKVVETSHFLKCVCVETKNKFQIKYNTVFMLMLS